jgi:hypothetical protein
MNKLSKIYYILYNRLLTDETRRKKLKMLCVFMFGCVCGFISKFVGKKCKGEIEIRNKLALLDKKKEELAELNNNLENVKSMIYELREQLEEKKMNC